MRHKIFLVLDKELKTDVDYTIEVNKIITGKQHTFNLNINDTTSASDLIKVNQSGYVTNSPIKRAYLGGYLGSLGALPLDMISGVFRVVDIKSGKAEYEGKAVLSEKADKESGEDVYWLDFTELKKPGRYVVEVEGLGRSFPFRIGPDGLNEAFYGIGKGLYHQRCGIALKKPYTTFTHPVCHRMKAKLVTFHNSMDACMKTLPDKVDPRGILIDGWGGWHDAGDYDRLLSRHTRAILRMFEAYEANPEVFKDNQFNIPESGNSIPDLLDEAKWGLDWMERVYDASDGAFYYRIETKNYGWCEPHNDDQQLYCMNKYPFYSCYAGVPFAVAARLFRKYDAALADRYLKIAKAALAYGQKSLETAPDTDYHRGRILKAIAWGASELYRTTGEKRYHDIFLAGKERTSFSYAICSRADVDKQAQEACRSYFTKKARAVFERRHTTGYAICNDSKGRITSGGARVLGEALVLLQGYQFEKNEDYRKEALLRIDHYFGANPMSLSFTTGVGSRSPKDPCHLPSKYDKIDDPVSGVPVNGPHSNSPKSGSTHARVFGTNLFPAAEEYPILRNFGDHLEIPGDSEFTFRRHTDLFFIFGFLVP